jgi:chemotaxis protein methyltransferase CheR
MSLATSTFDQFLPAAAAPAPAQRPVELDLFRSLLSSRSGIDFNRHGDAFLENRLRRRMTEAGARTLFEYYRMVTTQTGGSELQKLIDAVAIHETAFFRNAPQFRTLESVAFPDRVRRRLVAAQRRVSVWSAGCSTGQEPYSIAMSFYDSVVLPDTWDLQVLATDISTHAIRTARRGHYSSVQVEGVPSERLKEYFDRGPDYYSVRQWVRRRVEFAAGNIFDGAPRRDLDMIFCRNLMIYLDEARQRRLVALFADALAAGGYLFLGHAESLTGLSAAFRMVSVGQGIAYQKVA